MNIKDIAKMNERIRNREYIDLINEATSYMDLVIPIRSMSAFNGDISMAMNNIKDPFKREFVYLCDSGLVYEPYIEPWACLLDIIHNNPLSDKIYRDSIHNLYSIIRGQYHTFVDIIASVLCWDTYEPVLSDIIIVATCIFHNLDFKENYKEVVKNILKDLKKTSTMVATEMEPMCSDRFADLSINHIDKYEPVMLLLEDINYTYEHESRDIDRSIRIIMTNEEV